MRSGSNSLGTRCATCIEELDWVASAGVRLPEVGLVLFGDVFVTPHGAPEELPAKIRDAVDTARAIKRRLHDMTVTVLDTRK
jgi:hypothetical protein